MFNNKFYLALTAAMAAMSLLAMTGSVAAQANNATGEPLVSPPAADAAKTVTPEQAAKVAPSSGSVTDGSKNEPEPVINGATTDNGTKKKKHVKADKPQGN